MERRRQQRGLVDIQPLGLRRNRGVVSSGFGEDLGSTNYTGRPKVARNPRTKSNKEKERENEDSGAVAPILDVDPDGSLDPIGLVSSQSSEAVTSSNAKPRADPTTASKPVPQPVPQPAPFRRPRPTKPASKASSLSKPKPTRHQTGKARRIADSDDEDPVSRPSSRFTTTPNGSKESSPLSEQESRGVKPTVHGPQPAPFKRHAQPGAMFVERDKPSTSAPKVPAPPPWKTGSALQMGPKRDTATELLDHNDITASQRVGESQIDRESLKSVRIPKKNDRNTKNITPVPIKEIHGESKKTSAFPMAGYAKEVAAKQVDEATEARSPRKRFKPDDVERIFKQAEQDELMGIDDETLPPLDLHNLCPFCDEPFPDNPSPDLIQLLTDLKKVAVSEPRLRNPNGLTAPLMTYINLCQMHRAESIHVEQGRRNHWPSVIDWDDVRERLKSPKVVKALRTIINDPHSSDFFVAFYNTIKRDGALKAASIRAQLDTFELSHPGYYGEQGSLIFFDTLNELFPNLTSDECKPLTTRQFFMSVLVPEAAALLIEQDMDCTHEEALITLRESRQYGLAMFPDRGGFFGSGKGDHMDEAGAKQLKWRKDVVGSTYSGNRPGTAQSPMLKPRFLEESDQDILIVD
ncbi:unnamed protein product [Rhizoctonia solani]|uniref:Restriction of telomere capping protein 4 n=1 Tax=Rhizoctonia solani TaxID=456999 RepID=A0A8H3H615_9AGAM|nr:unnamed protein product [Rhizoctonia solani]